MLRETLGPALRRWQIDILGSDMDRKALERAREGLYDPFSFEQLAPRYQEWIERYVTSGPQHRLDADIRAMVSFQYHDLLRDAPPAQVDLLLCRNVLIYFDRELQERLYRAFHEAVRADGYLVLGKTEVLPMAWAKHFPSVNPREHIYRRAEPDQVQRRPKRTGRRQTHGKKE
jgi:chemotaxis protein methyltransferase CheR